MNGTQPRGWLPRAVLASWIRVAKAALVVVCLIGCGRARSDGEANGDGGDTAGESGLGGAVGISGGTGVDEAGTSGATMADAGATSVNTCGASLAAARITLLTDAQWKNVVRDVLGVDIQDDITAPQLNYYTLNENAAVGTGNLRAYLDAADKAAALLKPCGADAANATCVEAFVRAKLPLAWRRPVTDAEVASLMALFNQGYQSGVAYGVKSVTRGMLLASSFLYRSELGADASLPGATITLNPYELASAVSFAFLDSVPDAELWSKAVDGSLTKPEVLAAQADRLLAIPAVQDNLRKKVSYYLKLELLRTPAATPPTAPTPPVTATPPASLYESGQRFLDDVVWHGRFSDLFTSHRVFVDRALSQFYGLPPVAPNLFVPLDVTDDTRSAGILSQPSFLVANGGQSQGREVLHRGLFVYRAFACGETSGTRPANEEIVYNGLTGSDRDRFRQVDQSSCGSCHTAFDPYGLALENYDSFGRYQVSDPLSGAPIDTSATITGVGADLDGPVSNVKDLAARFAKGRRASDCASAPLATMLIDHEPSDANPCFQSIKDELATNGSFSAFFRAVVISPAFLTRDLGAN